MGKTIQEAVAEKITQSGEYVSNTVIEKLAEVEISKRVDAITKAIQKQEQLEKDLKKINKNDVVTYIEGTPTEVMSKNRFEEIKKCKEKIEKLTKAIDFSLTQNSFDAYNKLAETLKKLDNAGGNKTEGPDDSE
jgi:hypothetical protein